MAAPAQSPVAVADPPPAPRPRQGLLKSFQGSVLLLMTKATDQFATHDPETPGHYFETRDGSTAGYSKGNGLIRKSDLFSQARSSASSFGSRGSFSGLWPTRPSSTPPVELASRDPSPTSTPRTSLSREDAEGENTGHRQSLSTSMVRALNKTKGDLTRRIRSKFSKNPSNLGLDKPKEIIIEPKMNGTNNEKLPPVNFPSYVKVIKPETNSNTTSVRVETPKTVVVEPTKVSPNKPTERPKQVTIAPIEASNPIAAATAPLVPEIILKSQPKPPVVVEPVAPPSHEEPESDVEDEDTEDDEDLLRNDILIAADYETIQLLAGRIKSRASAKAVVRISRRAEACMRGDAPNCLGFDDIIKCRDPPSLRYCFDEQGELIEGERQPDEYAKCTHKFYGEKRPKIALDRYLGRLVRYLDTFSECGHGAGSTGILALVGATILIDRLTMKREFVLDAMNTHRTFMVATLVALKVLDDEPCSNEYYANIGGVDMGELNHLETHLLRALDYDVTIHAFELKAALAQFVGAKATRHIFEQLFD